MLQLSSKVMFAHILHTFQMHPAQVPDVSCIWQKGCGTHVHLAAALSRGFALHRHVSCAFWMCLTRFLDACGRYLGAELYCILSYLLNCYVT